MLKNGFYTALGTPLTEDGLIIEGSLRTHIEQQIDAGAAGLLLMGSMGIEYVVRHSEYAKTVHIAADAVNGRVPLFVGAMDNSIARVKDRIDMIGNGVKIDGIVVTVPFYSPPENVDAIYWFTQIANYSPYPIYIYDLPWATQYRIPMSVIDELIKHPNIKGMKSANWELIKRIERTYPDEEFNCLYSGLDSFDYANELGIKKNLDGMFACTPKNSKAMYECLDKDDYVGARRHLDNILLLRDTMIENGLLPCFTHCMNLLGMDGIFHEDYTVFCTENAKEVMIDLMQKIGEI